MANWRGEKDHGEEDVARIPLPDRQAIFHHDETTMQLDITRTPFSKYGSSLSLGQEGSQLLIRNIRQKWGLERLFHLTFEKYDLPVAGEITATPWAVQMNSSAGTATCYLRGDDELVVDSHGVDLRLTLLDGQHGLGFQEDEGCFKILAIFGRVFITVSILAGEAIPNFTRELKDGHQRSTATELVIKAEHGRARVHLQVAEQESAPGPLPEIDPATDIAAVRGEWEAFLATRPTPPAAHADGAALAWYNLWSCFVRAGGNFPTDAVLMSKGCMGAVWSWDHCFNALALALADPDQALEQWSLPFALQRLSGVLPDYWTAEESLFLVVKPPIHGWALSRLLARQVPEPETLRRLYDALARWTEWWFTYRDSDGDGIPNYLQGVDSGWDNATLFDLGIGLEAPDLTSYLILQCRALADVATHLGEAGASRRWWTRAERLAEAFLEHSWQGDGFSAPVSRTHESEARPTSLLSVMPLVLGGMLPVEQFAKLQARLERDFLTAHGPATEMPASPKYSANGYWRGPIWAPTTYLLVDGLRRGGAHALATEIARRFVQTIEEAGGCYENYDALTGAGLCDQGYTWTASVYLLLVHEYLQA